MGSVPMLDIIGPAPVSFCVRLLNTDAAIATPLLRYGLSLISFWRMRQAGRTTKQSDDTDDASGRDFLQSVGYYREVRRPSPSQARRLDFDSSVEQVSAKWEGLAAG